MHLVLKFKYGYEVSISGRDSYKIPSPNIDTVFSYEDEPKYSNQQFDNFGKNSVPSLQP